MSTILQQKADWDNFRRQYDRMESIGLDYFFLHTNREAKFAEVLEMDEYHFKVMVNEYGPMGSHNYETYEIPYSYLYNYEWKQEVKDKIENDKKLEVERNRKEKEEKAKQRKEIKKQDEEIERHLYEQLKRKYGNENNS